MLRRLTVTMLVLTCFASAFGQGDRAPSNTLAVSGSWPFRVVAFYERTGWQIFGFEGAAGVEVRFDPARPDSLSVTPYAVFSYYPNETTAFSLEVFVPSGIVPAIGSDHTVFTFSTVHRW